MSSNIHPADLQQQNFQNMVRQATQAEEETKFYDLDDEMGEMREEAIDDFEMAFDKEREMREESNRRVAEQVKLSHSHDHYKANRAQSSGSYYSGSFTYTKIKNKNASSSLRFSGGAVGFALVERFAPPQHPRFFPSLTSSFFFLNPHATTPHQKMLETTNLLTSRMLTNEREYMIFVYSQ